MAKITWDENGERRYETGINQGVLYVYNSEAEDPTKAYEKGEAWNGLSTVSEKPEGAEANDIYADNIKYLSLLSAEKLGITIEAYTFPDGFMLCDGTAALGGIIGVNVGQQSRKTFGLAYKTIMGNDVDGNDAGYKLHLVYGCKASPSERSYQTVNESPEAIAFSWEINTTPVTIGKINGVEYKPTSIVTIDSTKFKTPELKAKLAALEDKLFGTEDADAYLPLPAEVYSLLSGNAIAG